MLLNCESPLDCKEIQPVNPKGNQSWIFIWRTDVEAETPILWLPDVKNWLIWKDPDAGKDWCGRRRGQQRWDGWIASRTQWTCVWPSFGSWWRTGKPGMLQFIRQQRVGYNWVAEQQESCLVSTSVSSPIKCIILLAFLWPQRSKHRG